MLKYNIEGNIDFYAELYKSLDQEENEHKTEEDNNLCLISNEPLTDKRVELLCGHKFNYIPLYLDVKTHKQLFNLMEGSGRLNVDEIRCPYCRKKQKGLLPYYHELGLKDHGVNFIDPNTKTHYYVSSNNKKKCEYLTPNPDYVADAVNTDASNNSVIDEENISNQKFLTCHYLGFQINYKSGSYDSGGSGYLQGNDYGDTKCYCWDHRKIMIKKYKQEIKDKIKEEMNQTKLKKKEEATTKKEEEKQKKEEEKQKRKEEKQKQKEAKKNSTKNVVLGPSIIGIEPDQTTLPVETNESSYCVVILKSGTNKGKPCGFNVFSENVCKRHFSYK